LNEIFHKYNPTSVIHLAAESHVDKSIQGPSVFINTNILGTYSMLESALGYWKKKLTPDFRFIHVSTDEVYGSQPIEGGFTENCKYAPSSPYSASKAASDHLARAWNVTYGLPVIVTNCSNNYGPFQYPEKFIPLMIANALEGKSLPIYGDGKQVRDWLYVDDHVRAILKVLDKGRIGETYNIGADTEKENIEVVHALCLLIDEIFPQSPFRPHFQLVRHVEDRLGHDRHYAINSSKLKIELGWLPEENFESGLKKTINWYINNKNWLKKVQSKQKS
jgi:dTDP-glucose 4,6-dehydratase